MADPTDIGDPSITEATYVAPTDKTAAERGAGVVRIPAGLYAYLGSDGKTHLPANVLSALLNVPHVNIDDAGGSYMTFQSSGTAKADIGTANNIFGGGSVDDLGIAPRTGNTLLGAAGLKIVSVKTTGAEVTGSVTVTGNFLGPAGGFTVGATGDGVRIFPTSHSVDITTNSVSNRLTVDSTGLVTVTRPLKFASFTVSTVPSASSSGAGATIYVSNESGGAVLAFSDGTNWKRVTDRATIS